MELGETPPELVDLQERILMGGVEAVAGTSTLDGGEVEKRAGKRGREVMAKPSGNNSFTFFMPEEEEDEFDGGGDEEEEDMELDAVQSMGRAPGDKAREYDDSEPGEDLPRERQLTQKFLAGQLSFKDLMQEMNEKDDREDEDEYRQDSDDEDWKPSPVKSRPRATRGSSQANSPEARPSVSERKRSMESFETELEDSQKAQLRRKKKGSSSVRRRRLDPALQGLMGEANLRFAKGDTDTAERMCMEVIRQDPTAPEPFQTLATLYEEQGELERSLQFGLLAAHLAPQDGEEWARLADMSLEQGEETQAADCYKKAIDAAPGVTSYHFTRARLLEQIGDRKGSIRCYRRLLVELGDGQGEQFIQATKLLAKLLHQKEDLEEAAKCFSTAFEKFPENVDNDDVNLYLELLISLGWYNQALEVCCELCGVQFGGSSLAQEELSDLDSDQQLATFGELVVPADVPADIRAKLIVALVHLNALHLINDLCQQFLEADIEDFGDLVIDIVEAMMKMEKWESALPLLLLASNSDKWGEAAVWLQRAECEAQLGKLEEAEQSYTRVVALAPHVYQARLQLSLIMRRLGRAEDALDTLKQDEQAELLNPHLMYERCTMLLAEGKTEEFINKSILLLYRHFVNIRNKDEQHAISSVKKMSSKNRALHEVRTFRREPLNEVEGPEFEAESQVTAEQEFELYSKVCDVLFQQKRFVELQRITFSALGSPVFAKKAEIIKECEFLCLLASFFNGDSYHAYNLVRELVVKNVDKSSVWNLFNLVIMRADDVRHNRFLMRLMSRNPDNPALGILNGHNCLVAGTYKYSLGEYMSAFKADSNNPLTALMLGLTFCHMACQKFSAKKHSLVVQACAFLNTYRMLRGPCQEVCFNLGRAMHQLSLLPAALYYYKQGLELGPSVGDDGGIFDLSREIAFNMSLIYQGAGNLHLARMYTEKYIVV